MPQSTEYHPIIGALRQRASALGKTVAMPETEDSRTFYATAMALDAGICRVVLVGAPARITPRLESLVIDLSAVGCGSVTDRAAGGSSSTLEQGQPTSRKTVATDKTIGTASTT